MDKTSENLREALRAWRKEHPTATLRQIEEVVDVTVAKVRAEMVNDLANASAAATGQTAEGKWMACPKCEGETEPHGRRKRRLNGPENEQIELTRRYLKCKKCGHSFFPSGQ